MAITFFDSNSFFIDEKVNFFKFENEYKVYDEKGQIVGSVKQKIPFGQILLRLIVNKAMLPFKLDILDNSGKVLASLERGWTFFMSKISVYDPDHVKIATIRQKFKFLKPTFHIFNHLDRQIAEITGDWKAWNFVINDQNGTQIGTISKKWAGAMQEIFTSADKYNVSIDPNYAAVENKIAIVSCAITVDMVMKESK